MTVDWDLVVSVLPAVLTPVTAVAAAAKGPGALRSRVKHDVELIEKLPESNARTALLDLVHIEIEALKRYDVDARRDVPMLVVSLVVSPLLGYLTIRLPTFNKWWTIPLAVVSGVEAPLFLYGIFQTDQRRVPGDLTVEPWKTKCQVTLILSGGLATLNQRVRVRVPGGALLVSYEGVLARMTLANLRFSDRHPGLALRN